MWESGEDLGGFGVRENMIKIYCVKKFNFKKKEMRQICGLEGNG